MERLRAFTDAVLRSHRVLAGQYLPMCSCGLTARACPVAQAEHDILGLAPASTTQPSDQAAEAACARADALTARLDTQLSRLRGRWDDDDPPTAPWPAVPGPRSRR